MSQLDPLNSTDINDFSYTKQADIKFQCEFIVQTFLEYYKVNMMEFNGSDYSDYTWENLDQGLGGPLPPNSGLVGYPDFSESTDFDNNEVLSDPINTDNKDQILEKNTTKQFISEYINYMGSIINDNLFKILKKTFTYDPSKKFTSIVTYGKITQNDSIFEAELKGLNPILKFQSSSVKFNLYTSGEKLVTFAETYTNKGTKVSSFHYIKPGQAVQIATCIHELQSKGIVSMDNEIQGIQYYSPILMELALKTKVDKPSYSTSTVHPEGSSTQHTSGHNTNNHLNEIVVNTLGYNTSNIGQPTQPFNTLSNYSAQNSTISFNNSGNHLNYTNDLALSSIENNNNNALITNSQVSYNSIANTDGLSDQDMLTWLEEKLAGHEKPNFFIRDVGVNFKARTPEGLLGKVTTTLEALWKSTDGVFNESSPGYTRVKRLVRYYRGIMGKS